MTGPAATNSADESEDIWLVQLRTGCITVMTLNELDAAFQRGTVDESTCVQRDGSFVWARIGDLAGIDPTVMVPRDHVPFGVTSYDMTRRLDLRPPPRDLPADASGSAAAPDPPARKPGRW